MNASTITHHLKAAVIFNFLIEYNALEKRLKQIFENSLINCNEEALNNLYFLHGAKIGTYIDFPSNTVKLSEHKFKNNEKFSELTLIQIIKLNKRYKIMTGLPTTIKSENQSMSNLDFQDSIIKLIETRNLLAHELISPKFSTKHIIEILSDQKINELNYDFLMDFDIKLLDNDSKCILSNYYFMKRILNEIEKTNL